MSFWLNNPEIIFKYPNIKQLLPSKKYSVSENLNILSRVTIILAILGYIFLKKIIVIYVGIIILGMIIIYYKRDNEEGFTGYPISHNIVDNMNPFGNSILNSEVDNVYEKYKVPAKPGVPETEEIYYSEGEERINNSVKDTIKQLNKSNKSIDKIFEGIDGELNFENSMRNYYTVSDNNLDSFLKYCYGDKLPSTKITLSH